MAFVTDAEINDIRAKANIVDIIGGYIPLTQRGKNYLCVCPFHDDHSPSMSVSAEKQIYKCFSCGETGNVFTFVSKYEGVSFIEAVAIVAAKCGLKLSETTFNNNFTDVNKTEHEIMDLVEKFFQNNLKTSFGETAMAYLKDRGINNDIIKDFGIGLSLDKNDALSTLLFKKNYTKEQLLQLGLVNDINGNLYDTFSKRITFPLYDKDGHIVGFSARIYRGEKDTSKYINSRETKLFKKGETLYNYHQARDVAKREKEVIVVEGFMDAIRLSNEGVKNVVALQGTAMTKNQIQLLKKLRVKVILCLDNDNAGLLATVNNGELLSKEGIEVFVIRLSGQKDPDEYILANGIQAFLDNLKKPLSFFEFKINYLKNGKDLNNSLDLAQYINDVLKDLSESNDEILREITLNKISKDYNLSLDVLKTKLSELKPVTTAVIEEKKEVVKKEKKDAYVIGAEQILYFMMNGEKYIREYQKKLGFFPTEIYRETANEILYYFENNKTINVADFITYVSDKGTLKDEVTKIVNSAIDGEELTLEAMDEYIDVVNKLLVNREIKRLKQQMKNELDVDKKMKIAIRIADLKRGSVDNG